MLTEKTALNILTCQRAIESAKQLMGASGLQLSIPDEHGKKWLHDLHPELAGDVLRAFIAAKNLELAAANETAAEELKS